MRSLPRAPRIPVLREGTLSTRGRPNMPRAPGCLKSHGSPTREQLVPLGKTESTYSRAARAWPGTPMPRSAAAARDRRSGPEERQAARGCVWGSPTRTDPATRGAQLPFYLEQERSQRGEAAGGAFDGRMLTRARGRWPTCAPRRPRRCRARHTRGSPVTGHSPRQHARGTQG